MTKPKQTRKPGGGRKPLAPNDPTIGRKITMPKSLWDAAEKIGPTASAAIRSALQEAIKRGP
jgi:hypothetical protein